MDIINTLLTPFTWFVSFVLSIFHDLFGFLGLNSASGWTWTFSIIGLVILIRVLLIPLFVRQIKAQRGMQAMQPELKKLQKKYKGKKDPESRRAMAQEQQALFKKYGTNPMSSCLPLIVQMPFFFALFHMLNGMNKAHQDGKGIGVLSPEQVQQFDDSSIFGAPLSGVFIKQFQSGSPNWSVVIIAMFLILAMSTTQFITQKQIVSKNQVKQEQQDGGIMANMANIQNVMLYILPVIFLISGINFPIGVLIYWTTTNLFTMGQQFYVIRRNPTPGSPAEKEYNARREAKGLPPRGQDKKDDEEETPKEPKVQRQQPKRNTSRKNR